MCCRLGNCTVFHVLHTGHSTVMYLHWVTLHLCYNTRTLNTCELPSRAIYSYCMYCTIYALWSFTVMYNTPWTQRHCSGYKTLDFLQLCCTPGHFTCMYVLHMYSLCSFIVLYDTPGHLTIICYSRSVEFNGYDPPAGHFEFIYDIYTTFLSSLTITTKSFTHGTGTRL